MIRVVLACLFFTTVFADVTRPPFGAHMPGVIQESTICEGYLNLSARFYGGNVTIPDYPIVQNGYFMELQDLENNRLAVIIDSPMLQINLWITPTESYQIKNSVCYIAPVPGNNLVDYLNLARTPLRKVDVVPPHADVYMGTAYEGPSGFVPMDKLFHIDWRNNHTVYENWIQPFEGTIVNGTCVKPPFAQVYGEIYFGYGGCRTLADFVNTSGTQALEDLFYIPPICNSTRPLTTDGVC